MSYAQPAYLSNFAPETSPDYARVVSHEQRKSAATSSYLDDLYPIDYGHSWETYLLGASATPQRQLQHEFDWSEKVVTAPPSVIRIDDILNTPNPAITISINEGLVTHYNLCKLSDNNPRAHIMSGVINYASDLRKSKNLFPKSTSLQQFLNVLVGWKNVLTARHYSGLKARLEFLFDDDNLAQYEGKQKPPSAYSFSVMLAYLANNPELKTPSITYNFDGEFSAIWNVPKLKRLTIDFISSTKVRWVYIDTKNNMDDSIHVGGVTPMKLLRNSLDVYGDFSWMNA